MEHGVATLLLRVLRRKDWPAPALAHAASAVVPLARAKPVRRISSITTASILVLIAPELNGLASCHVCRWVIVRACYDN